MNRHNLTRTIFGAALLFAFAACTQDELADGNGTSLPEGKYPLEIGSISLAAEVDEQPWRAGAPQTRVSENPDGNSSHWDNDDKIKVQIADGTPGTYTYQGGNLIIADGDAPAYWASKDDAQSIRAWHTSSGSQTVELGNQTEKLAYVLTAQTTADFNESVSLKFGHALAKVRVVLQGSDKDKVNSVMIKACTSCTLGADGSVTAGDTENFIPMVETTYNNGTKCWEANVVPDHRITEFQVNGIEGTLNNGITPLAAKVNTIELIVGKKVITGGATITEPGEYIISGSFDRTITLNADGVTLTLDNVSCEAHIPIKITQGTPTIKVKGTNNTLISKGDE